MNTIEQLLAGFNGTDDDALAFVKNYSTKKANARDIRTYLIEVGKWGNLLSLQMTSPLFNAADGLRLAAEEDRELSFDESKDRGQRHISMLDAFVSANLFDNEIDKPAIIALSIANKPFEAATLNEILAIRKPAAWQPALILSGNDKVVLTEGDALLSTSNRGAFRFITDAPCEIRISAKKADETQFVSQPQATFRIEEIGAHVRERGIGLSGYRHFIFEYKFDYEDAGTSVSVESIS